ncbi:MAG: hypothetical protein EBU84_02980 [Actinobacteria bacterium]|nr:hypothetical protein [Actinomycetota bacterium]
MTVERHYYLTATVCVPIGHFVPQEVRRTAYAITGGETRNSDLLAEEIRVLFTKYGLPIGDISVQLKEWFVFDDDGNIVKHEHDEGGDASDYF